MTTGQFWIYMSTIVLSALVAVQVSEYLRMRSEKRARQMWIFKTLMATRATGLAPEHVQALNLIPLEFRGKRFKDVLQAWKSYLDHLSTSTTTEGWAGRKLDLFFDLVWKMSMKLGYDLDMADMRRTAYVPAGHGELEEDQTRIRKALMAILEGKSPLPVSPYQAPTTTTLPQKNSQQ